MTVDISSPADIAEKLAKAGFNQSWQEWVKTNIAANCDKNGMFKILVDEGFSYEIARAAMNHEPTLPLDQIENPLRAKKVTEKATTGMTVTSIHAPFIANAVSLGRDDIEFYTLDDFLNESECDQLIKLVKAELRPSTLTSAERDTYFRTSSTCELCRVQDGLVAEVDRRIAAVMGLDPTCAEGIQGQHYEVGQQFKTHTDYFEGHELAAMQDQLGQRSYTFMIYLNDVEAGGETHFPRLNHTVVPKRGRAVIWNSLLPNGKPNIQTMHQGCPVLAGTKTIITKWFRSRGEQPAFKRETNENIPNHTRIGLHRDKLPPALFEKITAFYQANHAQKVAETVLGGFVTNAGTKQPASYLLELPQPLKAEIHSVLLDMAQVWSNIALKPTFVYGIRVYQNGTVLRLHRDCIGTHTFGVIINVDQAVREPWPLVIEDNYYRRHEVLMEPRDVFFYEGARLLHGRPTPLDGDYFANIFCHFEPVAG